MWAELGGFDERLSGTGGDETEFFMRGAPRRVPATSRRERRLSPIGSGPASAAWFSSAIGKVAIRSG